MAEEPSIGNQMENEVAMNEGDFEPSSAQDVDDEATIDEEETLEAGEGFNEDELNDLQKDAEVPIEDLIALYYTSNETGHDNADVALEDIQPEPLAPYEDNNDNQTQDDHPNSPTQIPQDSTESHPSSPSQNTCVNPPENQRITRGLAAAYQYFPDSDSSSSDEDYSPTEDWKKEIHIGPEHQAEVPISTSHYDDNDEKHNSKCLWSPKGITEQKLQKYVDTVCVTSWEGGAPSNLMSKGDDEQALYVLLQCNYNCDEAIKKFNSQTPLSQEMTFWSEEECRNFELGLRQFGKDFYSIQHSKIPDRTVGDIVQFYYLWKKTERHDAFSWQIRSKKKYSFYPGITDYMDRFFDENESAASSHAESPAHLLHSQSNMEESLKRPSCDDDDRSHSSLLHIPQSYVQTPVIVSKEPPVKKPNLAETPVINNSNSLNSNETLQIPHIVSHVAQSVAMVTNHVLHPNISSSSGVTRYSPLVTQHINTLHNIDSGNNYSRLTQNS